MRHLLHTLPDRYTRFLGGLIENKLLNTTDIVLRYVDKLSGPAFDPNEESSYPSREEKTAELGGLVHYVSAKTSLKQYTEIQIGDAILTFETTVDFSNKEKLRFEMDGALWVQAAVGKELAQYWDVVIGGEPMSQTILLRKA